MADPPTHQTTASYRLVKEGECLEAGDEMLRDDTEGWLPVSRIAVGLTFRARQMMPVRRTVKEPANVE